MLEKLRDKSRDRMAASLEAAGIQAEMVDRDLGRPEEKIRTMQLLGKASLGLIDILTDSPISWINVVRTKSRNQHDAVSRFSHLTKEIVNTGSYEHRQTATVALQGWTMRNF